MNDPSEEPGRRGIHQSFSTIRSQLIWASVFPLALFGLLTVLLFTTALQNIALNLILQHNTSLAQVAAANAAATLDHYISSLQKIGEEIGLVDPGTAFAQHASELKVFEGGVVLINSKGIGVSATPDHPELIGQDFSQVGQVQNVPVNQGSAFSLQVAGVQNGQSRVTLAVPLVSNGLRQATLLGFFSPAPQTWLKPSILQTPNEGNLFLMDASGSILVQTGQSIIQNQFSPDGPALDLIRQKQAQSILTEATHSGDQMIISYAPVGASSWGLVLEEPWQAIIAPATYYEWALAFLLILGIILSMVMLSVSIGWVIRPLADLSQQANQIGPGSIFRPLEETGPVELRALFRAFNQMLIRLAEQKTALHQYAEKALLSQEEERQRISHELHDETIQDLVGLVQRVDLCRDEMDSNPALAHHRLDELRALAEQALDDLRRISNALRPPILQDLGLATAVQSLCDDLTRQMPKIRCRVKVSGKAGRLPPALELAIFRVVQEAISNIRRHSKGTTEVNIDLEIQEPLTIATVQDNGSGFPAQDIQALVRDGHLGLAGMYERARLFNGEVCITSISGEGTTITLTIPVQEGMITDLPTVA